MTAFLTEHGARYTHVEFDVRIGSGRDPGKDFADNIRKMGLDLSRRRIDCVGHTIKHAEIVEVTGAAGTTTLGQLLTYKRLYEIDNPSASPPKLVLAARSIQTDMHQPLEAAGVEIHLYPAA